MKNVSPPTCWASQSCTAAKKQESAGCKREKRQESTRKKQKVFLVLLPNRTPRLSWDSGQHCVCACTVSWCRFAGGGFSAISHQGVSSLYSSAQPASNLSTTSIPQPPTTENHIFDTKLLSLWCHMWSVFPSSMVPESQHILLSCR